MNKLSFSKGWAVLWYPLLFGYLFLGLCSSANAASSFQEPLQIRGTVSDSQGTLPGVTINIKGRSVAAISGGDGTFSLAAGVSDTLVFSSVGYRTLVVPVAGRIRMDVVMQEDIASLQEVTVNAGYYKVKDRERTGSIARIGAKDIEKQPVKNPLEALQGRLTGVDIVQTSGVSGSGFEVKIRGQNSLMAGNAPLYVIDGVPFDAQGLGGRQSSGTIIPGGNISPLNTLNPSTIASIEVLKDADATSIYGSRGANGVVLITTKRGKAGRTSFTLGSSGGIASITRKRELLGTEDYLEMRREAFANDGIGTYPASAYDVNGTWDASRHTDWQEELIGGDAHTSQVQASVSGGSENTQFLISGMHQEETSVFPGSFKYDRITVNSNIRHKGKDGRFRMVFNAGYALEDNVLPGTDLTSNTILLSPNAPALYTPEGGLNWEQGTWTNPLAQLETRYTNNTASLIANTVLEYGLWKDLELKVNAGYSTMRLMDNRKIPHTLYNPAFGLNSSASQSYSHNAGRSSFIVEPQLSWSRKEGIHNLDVLLGSSFQSQYNDLLTQIGVGYSDNSFLGTLSAAKQLFILNENSQEYHYQSVFARINYSLMDKFFLNATGRRDGSSRFGPGNRYGNFGALGAAWLFSRDMGLPWLSSGKLRGSYGVAGNDQIGDYQYLQTYAIGDYPYDGNVGLQPTRLLNPHFKWEQSVKKEVAVELGLLEDRIAFSMAYYTNKSSKQLINYALPGTTGFASIQSNLDAAVENTGWEFELGGDVVRSDGFKWSASLNLSLPRNRLVAFPGLEASSYANQFVLGKPLSIVKLYALEGVDPETGLFEFRDYDGDGQLSSADRQFVGDLTPALLGGLSNSLQYGNWDLDVFFQFVKKEGLNDFFSSQPAGMMFNQPAAVMDRWQSPGDVAPMQRFTTGADPDAYMAYSRFSQSSGALSDASFIRLKSLALSYGLPFGADGKNSCRISLQGQNLLTLTRFEGGDPEQSIGFLPPLRRIVLGVQLHF